MNELDYLKRCPRCRTKAIERLDFVVHYRCGGSICGVGCCFFDWIVRCPDNGGIGLGYECYVTCHMMFEE